MIDKHHITSKRNPNGFTLVELLAVMVIILILSMIAFRVANFAGMKARNSRAEADLAQWVLAFQKLHDFTGHYDLIGDSSARGWFNRYREGLQEYDPWGGRYNCAAFNTISRTAYAQYAPGSSYEENAHSGTRLFPARAACCRDAIHRNESICLGHNPGDPASHCPRMSRAFQEFIVFSLGPDRAPGYRGINDAASDPEYPWQSHRHWNPSAPPDQWTGQGFDNENPQINISELGYGDDIVHGNSSRKRGFAPCLIQLNGF